MKITCVNALEPKFLGAKQVKIFERRVFARNL
ncbi:hypothetical protein FHS09_000295 [Microbulbifer rhizosphaerae]|uniref:Uncharacterized protein n=1 Tax=Microbulbifer rhizosphaerae TaxID=1562603 RepID=A0A7W4W8C7_9GAMM|nr:hypothetical protein [Microbulbifer rhizosphaerae]